MKLRVEYRYDPESRNCGFRVPSLGIAGGAETREQAAESVLEAIEFTLEGENDTAPPEDGEVDYLLVNVEVG